MTTDVLEAIQSLLIAGLGIILHFEWQARRALEDKIALREREEATVGDD
jgi:hypothetical protein